MKTLLAALLLLSPAAQAELDFDDLPYEERPEVKKIIDSPAIDLPTDFCPTGKIQFARKCVKLVPVPEAVEQEIIDMKVQQMDNDSDYDVRITDLLVVDHDSRLSSLDTDELKVIIKTLGIPAKTDMQMSLYSTGIDFQDNVGGLSINGEYELEADTHRYLTKLLKGKPAMVAGFHREVDLYPGGGIYGNWYIVITDNHIVYVKVVGWDS